MVFVAVRTQHRGETLAGAAMHSPQEGLLRTCTPPASLDRDFPPIRQQEGGHVQSVGEPVLRQLPASNPVASPARVGRRNFNLNHRRTQVARGRWRDRLSDPIINGVHHRAAQDSRRPQAHAAIVRSRHLERPQSTANVGTAELEDRSHEPAFAHAARCQARTLTGVAPSCLLADKSGWVARATRYSKCTTDQYKATQQKH